MYTLHEISIGFKLSAIHETKSATWLALEGRKCTKMDCLDHLKSDVFYYKISSFVDRKGFFLIFEICGRWGEGRLREVCFPGCYGPELMKCCYDIIFHF